MKLKPIGKNEDNLRFQRIDFTMDGAVNLARTAADEGLSVSEVLERLDPSWDYKGHLSELTAFERQLLRFNLPLQEDRKRGVLAAPMKFFLDSEDGQRLLFKETIEREVRLTPWDSRWDVDRIIAGTRYIEGESTKGIDIDLSELESNPSFRVGPGAEFPTVQVSWSEHAAEVYKRGVAIDWSYELLRRQRIDMVRTMTQRIMLAVRKASFDHAVSVMLNGETPITTETLDPAGIDASTKMTHKAWLKALNLFGPYVPDIAIGTIDTILEVIMAPRPNLAPADVLRLLAESQANNVPYVANVPNFEAPVAFFAVDASVLGTGNESLLIMADSRFAVERIVEIGSDIRETEKFITNQTQKLVTSVNEGYSKLFDDAIHVIDVTTGV